MPSDRRPARANSKATGPGRAIPAGFQKCGHCGRTLPDRAMVQVMPVEWTCCLECYPKTIDTSDKFKNPLSH